MIGTAPAAVQCIILMQQSIRCMMPADHRLNPRALDVQLLLAFDALITQRHVTRAARQLGISQSALSHALARLRERFDDPLLVRTAHGMEPTARALQLAEPVRAAIRHVEAVFASKPVFAPHESRDTFVLRIGDTNEFWLLPPLLAELEKQAPGVTLVVRHLSPADTAKALEDGSVDFAIMALLSHSKSIRSRRLLGDRMVCVMARNHPAVRQRLTAERFLALRQIVVAQDAGDTRFVGENLRVRGLNRHVIATTPHLIAGLHTVMHSRLAMAVPERVARAFDVQGQLAVRQLPIGGERFDWQLYWHRRYDAYPAQRWMRDLVVAVCARIEQSGS